ncbi:MAG: sugar transferase [Verrucomicrobiota bacterium]
MLGRRQEFNLQLHQLLDSVLLFCAFAVSHAIRWHATGWLEITQPIRPFHEFLWVIAIVVPFTPVVLEMHGFYNHPLQKKFSDSIRQLIQAGLWMGLIVGGCIIFFKWVADSRAVLALFAASSAGLLLLKETVLKAWMRRQVRIGNLRVRVVLAGAHSDIEAVWNQLPEISRDQMEIVGRVELEEKPADRLAELFRERNVERVILAAEHMRFKLVEEAIRACETEGVEAWLSTDFLRTEHAKPKFDVLGGLPMLVFRMTPEDYWALLAKNVLDRVLALLLLILSSPIWLFAAIGIRRASPGPVIFQQERGGRYGKPFLMYKFRTMSMDAESQQKVMSEQNEQDGPAFKMTDDPRVFEFGRFLRKMSIDELPQLINILKGEMSLVGPRPLPIYEVERIEKSAQRRRLSVKPGLTCLWQVSGRSKITKFDEWVALDLKYIDNWSLWMDLRILWRTIPVVLKGSGAQ